MALRGEVPLITAIEEAAGILFLQYEFTASLASDITPLEDLYHGQEHDLLWVAEAPSKALTGFALVELFEGSAHLAELAVSPEYGRQGIGTQLVKVLCDWARSKGIPAVTLTTFREIPWNAPFYFKLGFRPVGPAEMTAELKEAIDDEERRGLPRELRVAMRLQLTEK